MNYWWLWNVKYFPFFSTSALFISNNPLPQFIAYTHVCLCLRLRAHVYTNNWFPHVNYKRFHTSVQHFEQLYTHTPESPPLKLSFSPFISLSWSLESQYRHHSNNSRAQTWSISKWKHILNQLIAIVKIWKHYTICTGHTLRHHLQLLRNRRDVLVKREAIFINRMIDFRIKANSSTNTCNETEKKIGFEMVNIV